VHFCEQSIDYSMSDKNLTLHRLETWTVAALKRICEEAWIAGNWVEEGALHCTEILVAHVVINALFTNIQNLSANTQ